MKVDASEKEEAPVGKKLRSVLRSIEFPVALPDPNLHRPKYGFPAYFYLCKGLIAFVGRKAGRGCPDVHPEPRKAGVVSQLRSCGVD